MNAGVSMDPIHFRQLLAQGEGSLLDYKMETYSLENASRETKGEILKDILAMANAWGESEGYILCGVEELSGRPARVVGIKRHLDDADLQQFVNTKLNRTLAFSYREFLFESLSVGVIAIPRQKRPFFLKERFGKLGPGEVPVRRGSSTFTADADDIHAMGEAWASLQRTPTLSLEFGDRKTR